MKRTSTIRIIAAAIATVALLAGCSTPPTTTYTNEAGESVTVSWDDFPAYAYTDTDAVLAGPTSEEVPDRAEAILSAMWDALGEQFGVDGWTPNGDDGWYPGDGNGYGGKTMLVTYNSVSWEADAILTVSERRRLLTLVGQVAAGFGLDDSRGIEQYEGGVLARDVFSGAEFLGATADSTRVSLFYGISTLAEADRAEFAERAEPFVGLEHPYPRGSD